MEKFVVFKGEETIRLGEKDGVVVLYGGNGKGKTCLVNGFGWGWSGEVGKGRRGRGGERVRGESGSERGGRVVGEGGVGNIGEWAEA
ncbi:AAA family ATPase [Kocuria rosea]|uniref:AAA family ATPase n=1 Tax=Kocuria rosea TaxID=1275 RepID=UPI0021B56149|nr:AAA family ATPase [Kocuria rosea]